MSDPLKATRCEPTQNLSPLEKQFREIARAQEERNKPLGLKAMEAAVGGAAQHVRSPISLARCDWTKAQQYAHYQQMLEARGFAVDPVHPTVVALRGLSADGKIHETTSAAKFDDTIVVLTRDAKGDPQVTTFPGSTHAGQSSISKEGAKKSGVKDADGKGGPDVGMINAGEYKLVPRGSYNGATAWDVRTADGSGVLPGVRDTNHDGKLTAWERFDSVVRGDALDSVMIHQGGPNAPQSVGCINLSRNPEVYPQFVGAIGSGKEPAKLVILDANEK